MKLTEFAWQRDDSGSYQGDQTLDCQIGITADGHYEVRNHEDPSQSEKFDSPEEVGDAIAKALAKKAEELS